MRKLRLAALTAVLLAGESLSACAHDGSKGSDAAIIAGPASTDAGLADPTGNKSRQAEPLSSFPLQLPPGASNTTPAGGAASSGGTPGGENPPLTSPITPPPAKR